MGGEKFLFSVLLGISLVLATASAYTANSDGVSFNCTSCTDCTNAINDGSRSIVYLINDINDHAGFCINDPAGFNNITFDCLGNTIDGDGTYDADDIAVFINGKTSNTIRGCVFTEWFVANGIIASVNNTAVGNTYINNQIDTAFQWGSYNKVLSNTHFNNSFAVYALNVNNTNITGNNMTNCTRPLFGGLLSAGCILLNMSNNSIIQDNIVSNGLVVDYISKNNTFLLNRFYNGTFAILASFGAMNSTIHKNIIRNSSDVCVLSFLSDNVTWTENNISECDAGWSAFGGANYSFRDNNITDAATGIETSTLSDNVRIWGNYLADCDTGIDIGGASPAGTYFLVATNEIYRTTVGILLDNSDNLGVYNNTIWYGNGGEGIFLDGGSDSNNIGYNDIRFKNTSILVHNADSNNIGFNFLSDNTNGLKLGNSADYNNIMSNFITRSSDFGIYVPEPGAVGASTPGARENQIINNTFNDTEVYYGTIWMATYVPNNFSDNRFIYPDDNGIVAFERIYFNNIYGEYEADYAWALDEVKPAVAVNFAKTGPYLSMLAPPVRGMYYIRMNRTDRYDNTYSQRVYYFADVGLRQRLRYYMRGPDPTHGQGIVGPTDVGTLNTVPPTVDESTECQFGFVLALDNISNITLPALPFYYRSAPEPSVIMLQYLNNSFRYEVNRPSTSWDWQSFGMLRDYVEVGNILLFKYEFNATKTNKRYENTFAPQWTFPAVEDLYNVTLKFGRGDWSYDTFPAMNTSPGNMSWSDLVFTSYSEGFPRIIGVNGTETDILSFTGTANNMLLHVDGEERTNITVNMTVAQRYYVRYDDVCDSPDCPYVRTGEVLELYPLLGSEHEIVINTVPCPEDEEEDEDGRGEIRGYILDYSPPVVAPPMTPTGCTTDDDCADNEYCSNRTCLLVPCPCGLVSGHACAPYECCADSDCPEDEICVDHMCVEKPEEEPEVKPLPPKPEEKPPVKAPEAPADMTWLWIFVLVSLIAAIMVIYKKHGSNPKSLRSV